MKFLNFWPGSCSRRFQAVKKAKIRHFWDGMVDVSRPNFFFFVKAVSFIIFAKKTVYFSLFPTQKILFSRFSQSKNSILAHPLVKITKVKIIMAMHLGQKSFKILSIHYTTVISIMYQRISFRIGCIHAHDCKKLCEFGSHLNIEEICSDFFFDLYICDFTFLTKKRVKLLF